MNNRNQEQGIRYLIRKHVEKHAVRPWFSGATAIAGAIAGLLGALYADQIKEAFPFFWGAGHIQFHAVAFWGLVILFGWMFGANFWAQSNATDRQLLSLKASTHELKAGVSAVHETSRSLIDLVRTLPPHDFLENFAAYLYRCYPAAVRALGEGAGREEITEGIVSVLSSLAYTAKFFDGGGSDTEYSANVMIYRDFQGLDAARTRAATSNSPTRGQVKIPQLTAAGRCDDYPAEARLATRSAASFRRQLLPSNFSRFPRCMRRSRSGATTTTSPNSFGQSSIGRFEVNSVEDLS